MHTVAPPTQDFVEARRAAPLLSALLFGYW